MHWLLVFIHSSAHVHKQPKRDFVYSNTHQQVISSLKVAIWAELQKSVKQTGLFAFVVTTFFFFFNIIMSSPRIKMWECASVSALSVIFLQSFRIYKQRSVINTLMKFSYRDRECFGRLWRLGDIWSCLLQRRKKFTPFKR